MKADIHPKNYRPVIFRDTSTGQAFLTKQYGQAFLDALPKCPVEIV